MSCNTESLVHLDGSLGEGGGQILRTALTLSLITRTPFTMTNIRVKRMKPGLMPQHIKAVQAAAEIGGAQVDGAKLKSRNLDFYPADTTSGVYTFDIGTAGATSLVLQTIYLPLAFTKRGSEITIKGGTHVPYSPCFHYLQMHWRKYLHAMGLDIHLQLLKAGFYPPGGGLIKAEIHPIAALKPLQLMQRGPLLRIHGISAFANLSKSVAERQRDQALRRFREQGIKPYSIDVDELAALSKGTLLLLLAEFENSQACFFALGQRGKPAERVADEAVDQLLEFLSSNGAIDPYLADQLMLPLAITNARSDMHTSRITQHQLTNATVIEKFLAVKYKFENPIGCSGVISCLV